MNFLLEVYTVENKIQFCSYLENLWSKCGYFQLIIMNKDFLLCHCNAENLYDSTALQHVLFFVYFNLIIICF